jgi:hypothetical protein
VGSEMCIRDSNKIDYYIDNDLPYSIELDSVFGILTFLERPNNNRNCI